MLTLTHFTKTLLLTTSFLLLTGCNDNKTDTEGTSTQTSQASLTQVTSSPEYTKGLKNLILTLDKTTLNKDENTTVKVMATYEDGTSKEVTDKVEWIVTPVNSISVIQNRLTAKEDSPTTLKTKLGTILSNSINLDITWTVNGHTLPPEPDKALNDSTLLGIDLNNNGVRDDVERYIYERFRKDPEYPKTKIALAMQDAWATQKILETPTIESKKYLDDAIDCQYYWFSKKQKKEHNKIIELSHNNFTASTDLSIRSRKWRAKNKVFNDIELKDIKLNTKERILRKFKFNEACSGHIFRGRKKSIESCQTNIDILGE